MKARNWLGRNFGVGEAVAAVEALIAGQHLAVELITQLGTEQAAANASDQTAQDSACDSTTDGAGGTRNRAHDGTGFAGVHGCADTMTEAAYCAEDCADFSC